MHGKTYLAMIILVSILSACAPPPPVALNLTAALRDAFVVGAPFWSPDGKYLAFVADASSPDGAYRLEIVNPDGGGLRQLAPAADVILGWSPDGARLLYCLQGPAQPDNSIRLYSVALDGSAPTDITTPQLSAYLNGENGGCTLVLSPDGTRLAGSTNAYGGILSAIDLDGAHLHALTPPLMGAYDFAWSPDAATLLFRSTSPQDLASLGRLYRVHFNSDYTPSDNPPVELAHDTTSNAAFSPDGKKLAFAENQDVYTITPPDTRPVSLAHLPDPVTGLAWSPDGTRLALSVGERENDIYVIAAGGGNLRFYSNPGLTDLSPRWSPDGRQLAFVSSQNAPQDGRLVLLTVDRLPPYPGHDIPPVFIWPLPGHIPVTQAYSAAHPGLDLAATLGANVLAAAPGVVDTCRNELEQGLGKTVIITHANGYKSLYAHLDQITVDCGQTVTSGQPIGTVGRYGPLDKPYLFFEVIHRGAPADPLQLLPSP